VPHRVSITILLADDHEVFRQGLRRFLETQAEFRVVAEAASGIEAVNLARQLQPNVAVLDVRMKDLNGIEAVPQILRHSPRTAVLMLSMHGDKAYVTRSVEAGAKGYLLKDGAHDLLVRAIEALHQGLSFFSPNVSQFVEGRFS
jgi:DNA-binding NarL/FixJ family response regulator